jgi:uncharacterized protein YigA (DUF484 family)
MKADEIARYLQDHPEVLRGVRRPAGAALHPASARRAAISITERQILTLREKAKLLEGKLGELIRFGEENDAIGEKVHRLCLSLLLAESFELVNHVVYTHLQDDFAVPHVRLRIWNSILKRESDEFIDASEELRFFAADLRQPYCGPAQFPEILEWFGESAAHLASLALIPLRRDAQVFGMLALGSEDPQRFFPEMGTMYVERIGDLVGAAVLKQIG